MSPAAAREPLLWLEQVRKYFPVRAALPWSRSGIQVRAVDGVSLEIGPHETTALVGESGCGKSTLARLILRLAQPTAGRILFRGEDVWTLRGRHLKEYRRSVQAVFQDPWSSFNPRMRAASIVAEPLVVNTAIRGSALRERVAALFTAVGLDVDLATSFPHELSGGMRQRLAIARALALRPELIVLDEPVSALDVSIRAQIMNLLYDLQEQFGIAYFLIAHNLATVRYLSHRIAVMYLGEVVEAASADDLFSRPLHPYTQTLLAAATTVRPGEAREEASFDHDVPSPTAPPPGCRFHPRCPWALPRCFHERATLREVALGRSVACHLHVAGREMSRSVGAPRWSRIGVSG